MDFLSALNNRLIFVDGGMGTMLQKCGLPHGERPETFNFTGADAVVSVHRQYLRAGCDVISANTFGANRYALKDSGYTVSQVVEKAVENARRAIAEEKSDALVALDVGPLGKLLEPAGELSFDDAYEAFAQTVRAGADKADLIIIETFTDTYELKAAVLAAKENASLPICATCAFDENGVLLNGADIDCVVALLEGLGVDVIGFNCGTGPEQVQKLLPRMLEVSSTPVLCSPNAGLPEIDSNGNAVYSMSPDEFSEYMLNIAVKGAACVGGCCGTTPAHIAEMITKCRDVSPVAVSRKGLTVVTSANRAVRFGSRPLVIGERINPTGKSKFKQALRDNDINYILNEALAQQESGADILDVNVGLPEIDEAGMLCSAMKAVQGVTSLPLQLDTMNTAAMEKALRHYNGIPMINSVNGKKESLDSVFPLAKKYGGIIVCLTLDEKGIPDTAEERLEIATRILAAAEACGIDKCRLVIDPLTITVSTNSDAADITLDALTLIKDRLGLNTVLGVSNISFGLPQRERINSTFFTMALARGLSAGIINPLSDAMMGAYRAFCAVSGNDNACANYISKYNTVEKPAAKQAEAATLSDCIVKGLSAQAADRTRELLTSKGSLEIIDDFIVPALDAVGRDFEDKRAFLPQLLMSAEAARSAFEVIKTSLSASEKSGSKGNVLLATVEGDVHDIGKNILRALLENYGFDVTDLGKDVPAQRIVDTVIEKEIPVVGLSALMTTTVESMKKTVEQLRQQAPWCKIMVGGAVMTQTYADMMGADFYSKDAIGAVKYCQKLLA